MRFEVRCGGTLELCTRNAHPELQRAMPPGPEYTQMVTPPSDYFSALSLSRNLCGQAASGQGLCRHFSNAPCVRAARDTEVQLLSLISLSSLPSKP